MDTIKVYTEMEYLILLMFLFVLSKNYQQCYKKLICNLNIIELFSTFLFCFFGVRITCMHAILIFIEITMTNVKSMLGIKIKVLINQNTIRLPF